MDVCVGCLGSRRCWVCLGSGHASPQDQTGRCGRCDGTGRCPMCREIPAPRTIELDPPAGERAADASS